MIWWSEHINSYFNEFQQIGTKRKRNKIKENEKQREETKRMTQSWIPLIISSTTIQRTTMVRFNLLVHYKQWATPFVFVTVTKSTIFSFVKHSPLLNGVWRQWVLYGPKRSTLFTCNSKDLWKNVNAMVTLRYKYGAVVPSIEKCFVG